jgi:hypothetical protein
MKVPERLSQYPYVVVRFECTFCPWRRGVYRLARLAERFGAEASLDHVRQQISKDCPRHRARGTQMAPRCHVWYTDLVSANPHDLPDTQK